MRCAAALLVLAGSTATAAPVMMSSAEPHPGIRVQRWIDSAVPARISLVQVDLTSAEIALYTTKESDRGITTSFFAARMGVQVAINGDAFAVAGYTPRGLAIGDSSPWTNTMDTDALPVFHMRRVGERTLAELVPPEVVVDPATLPSGTQGAVSGRPLLVRAGTVATSFDCSDPMTLACERAPRSALALSADRNTLWLAVVDGWQSGSVGLTAAELAGFLEARGAHMAMALDGGSSSTLVIDGALASSPSDGIERTVANHLGIKYGALPRGELVGFVCLNSVFDCTRVSGATVTLDDGRSMTTPTDGLYRFQNVTPRLACVTVQKSGYLTKTQCQTVSAGIQTYNSVVLEPGMDPPPDAGVPDAGVPDDAGADVPDAGVGADAGISEPPSGSTCGAAGGHAHVPIALALLVGWRFARRRGTKA